MSDLVQRLRGRANGMWPASEGSSLLREAAGRIEELEALLREARPLFVRVITVAHSDKDTPASEPECKCNLRTKLVGDGCEACNPELAEVLTARGRDSSTTACDGGCA